MINITSYTQLLKQGENTAPYVGAVEKNEPYVNILNLAHEKANEVGIKDPMIVVVVEYEVGEFGLFTLQNENALSKWKGILEGWELYHSRPKVYVLDRNSYTIWT